MAVSGRERIDDFNETETMEVRVSRADLPHSVLAHGDRRVRVVEDVPGQVLYRASASLRRPSNHFRH